MCEMTNRVLLLEAVAKLKAVGSVVALGTHLLALLAHETGTTEAMTVGLSAHGTVGALALMLAVISPRVVRAGRLTQIASPARQAVTDSVDVRALAAVLAEALLLAVSSVGSLLARVIAGDSDVAGPALEFAGHVIARRLRWHVVGAFLFAVQAEVTV